MKMKSISKNSLVAVCSSFILIGTSGCGGGGSSTPANTTSVPTNTGNLTLEACEQEYTGYDNAQWAQALGNGPDTAKATACYQALVASPLAGQDPQLYIDAYNSGTYNNLDGTQNTNNNTDQSFNSSRTDLSYMMQHPAEKLSSSDCSAYKGGGETVSLVWQGNTLVTPIVQGQNSWSDVESALLYYLAPTDAMYLSVDACNWIQTSVEYGGMDYSEAVSIIKRATPSIFSD
jgi:hypothetical protein